MSGKKIFRACQPVVLKKGGELRDYMVLGLFGEHIIFPLDHDILQERCVCDKLGCQVLGPSSLVICHILKGLSGIVLIPQIIGNFGNFFGEALKRQI